VASGGSDIGKAFGLGKNQLAPKNWGVKTGWNRDVRFRTVLHQAGMAKRLRDFAGVSGARHPRASGSLAELRVLLLPGAPACRWNPILLPGSARTLLKLSN